MATFNWISVKDKMPEDGRDVLVCGARTLYGDMYITFVGVGRYYSQYRYWEGSEIKDKPAWIITDFAFISEYDHLSGYVAFRDPDDSNIYIVTSWAPLPDASEEAIKLVRKP